MFRVIEKEMDKTFRWFFSKDFKTKKEALEFLKTHEGYKLQKKVAYEWKDWN